jgi:hypothetical protein
MDRPQFLIKVVNWLREGYPNGVPTGDYIPLVALLRRQLSEDEVKSVSRQLIHEGQMTDEGPEPIRAVDAGVLITKITDELPFEADIARIRAHLEEQGWPFDPAPSDQPGDD